MEFFGQRGEVTKLANTGFARLAHCVLRLHQPTPKHGTIAIPKSYQSTSAGHWTGFMEDRTVWVEGKSRMTTLRGDIREAGVFNARITPLLLLSCHCGIFSVWVDESRDCLRAGSCPEGFLTREAV